MTDLVFEEELMHYGVLRRSGRYPWGSGENPYQSGGSFLGQVYDLRKQGLTDTQIAEGMGITTTQLRARMAIANNERVQDELAAVRRLAEQGYSNVAIAKELGLSEATVRNRRKQAEQPYNDIYETTANMLADTVSAKGPIDIGVGVETQLGISKEKLNTAVAMLKEDGYEVHYVKVEQLGTGEYTSVKVLVPPGMTYSELYKNRFDIESIESYSDDGGRTFEKLLPPIKVDPSRVSVMYGDEGGEMADGLIELRRGVDDISLGTANYAQVRIAVGDDKYLKGMATYVDDLPDGVDIRFNTNKKNTGNKLDAMKDIKDDADSPFGSNIKRQSFYIDANGKRRQTAINIVNEEGDWDDWSRNLSSQFLSKQMPDLVRSQLSIEAARRQADFDKISSLTNPAVRKRLLSTFADEADSAAVHLKAAALPRQKTKVLLPLRNIKDNEIYAPSFRDGETVALVRYPHGGRFEIPELTVNNRNASGRKALGKNPLDAVGINSKVAARLSGADFDGDTVLVIPTKGQKIKTSSPLKGLQGFDPQASYPGYKGMKRMTKQGTGKAMGDVSNLITDMTIKGASDSELARAVRHSMVVIDAQKHGLNYRQSAKDNGITQLKKKYQGGGSKGASTLISRASGQKWVSERKARPASEGGPIDKKTGKKVYVPTGRTRPDGTPIKIKSTQMAETSDARRLSSGTVVEEIYASHANKMKGLGNQARKAAVNTPPAKYSPSAAKTYSKEVNGLRAALNVAKKNAPRERRAQLLANAAVKTKRANNPDMDADDVKKAKAQSLAAARARTGANKQRINITNAQWDAIQAGAVSNKMLEDILTNSDLDRVKELATPKQKPTMTSAKASQARSMLNRGYTQAEVADALGVSVSTLNRSV